MTSGVRVALRWAVAALIPLCLIAATAASAAPSAAVQRCVQLNLPKYTNPGSAVVAQYSDVETTCRAALDDGSVSVHFDSGGSSSGTGGGSGGGAGGSGAGGSGGSSGGGATAPATPASTPRTTPKPAPA